MQVIAMRASELCANQKMLLLVVIASVFQLSTSFIGSPSNLLKTATTGQVSYPYSTCCRVGGTNCTDATASPTCAFDDNSSTVWTMKSGQFVASFTFDFDASSILDRLELTLFNTSVIPRSITLTALSLDVVDKVYWTTYFRTNCSVSEETYLRKNGSQYYKCQRNNQLSLTTSVPQGLWSVQNNSTGSWVWWKPFQQLTVTIETVKDDDNTPAGNGSIAITDIRLFGWTEPSSTCNCHPAGIGDLNNPCKRFGACNCRPTSTNTRCVPDATLAIPTYGPVSGGTNVSLKGNLLLNLTGITAGNCNQARILKQNDTVMEFKTSGAKVSDIGQPLPIYVYFTNSPSLSNAFIIADGQFTFKPDPIISNISAERSLRVIVGGGVALTVIGQNLDSVAFPFLNIMAISTSTPSFPIVYLNYMTIHENYQCERLQDFEFCQVVSSSMMKCLTPKLSNLAISDTGIRIGISMDIDKYNNYSNCEILDGNCDLTVVDNPSFETWEQDPYVLQDTVPYPTYNERTLLTITGTGFQDGSSPDDYKIKVGGVSCEIKYLINNLIQFYPPDKTSIDTSKTQTVNVTVGCYSFTIGKLSFPQNDPQNVNPVIGGIVGGVGGVILVILAAFAIVWARRRCNQNTHDPYAKIYEKWIDNFSHKYGRYVIESERVKLGGEIGKGNFGTVYKGMMKNSDGTEQVVAVKTLKGDRPRQEIMEFVKEALIMADFCHTNVLSLIAIVIERRVPYVVLPFMEHGDLRGFVSETNRNFTVGDLVNFSLQVAKGMEYLASIGFVHRDLAARNCMVDKDTLVKVADFGLARDIFDNDYYRPKDRDRPLPVKWMAIECLTGNGKFSEKTDVWSYGVLVWELMARGQRPYNDVENYSLKDFLRQGRRLEKPPAAPEFMYDLMKDCWLEDQAERPTFKDIVLRLKGILYLSSNESEERYSRLSNSDRQVAAEARSSYLQMFTENEQ